MCGRNEHLQNQKELPGILSHQKAVFLLPSPLSALPLVSLYLLNPRKLPLLVAEPPSVFLVLAPWHFLFTLHFSMTTSLIFHPLLPVFLFFLRALEKKSMTSLGILSGSSAGPFFHTTPVLPFFSAVPPVPTQSMQVYPFSLFPHSPCFSHVFCVSLYISLTSQLFFSSFDT